MSVYRALDPNKYDICLIAIDREGRWLLPDSRRLLESAGKPQPVLLDSAGGTVGLIPFQHSAQFQSLSPGANRTLPRVDVILPILHGTFGEDGTVQGLLELAQIPYAGSGVLGSALGMDKDVSQRLFSAAHIPTIPTITVRRSAFDADASGIENNLITKLGLPLFIKPANAGSSVGVHKVKERSELAHALRDAFSYDTKILAQKAIDAREIEVAVLGNENPRASIVGEIVPRHEFYSYEAKYLDDQGAELRIPARDLTPAQTKQIQAWAIAAFQSLECRGMSRVDFFLDRKTGEVYINEINTIPGFTSVSMYPKLWEASGLPYAKLLDQLIQLALEAFAERQSLKTSWALPAQSAGSAVNKST